MSTTRPPPSTADKLGFAIVLLRSLVNALFRAITFPFLPSHGKAVNLYTDVSLTFIRTMTGSMTPAHDGLVQRSTEDEYQKYVQGVGLETATEVLPDGCKAHWIGSRDAENVILYLHGGGYMMAPSNGHFIFVQNLVNACQAHGNSVSALMLGYTRSWEASYPTQLREAVGFLKYALEDLKRHPTNILLAGDSAGGNLALALLSHLLHPHPDPSITALTLPSPLRTALLLSPSVTTRRTFPSFRNNRKKDNLHPAALGRWTAAFRDGAPTDPYNEPLSADEAWWVGMGGVVGDVLVWVGGDEVMRDGIVEWAEKLMKVVEAENEKEKGRRVELTTIVTPREYHAQIVVERVMGYKEPGDGARAVEAWLLARF